MEDYKNIQNTVILNTACSKMLKEKFNIILTDEQMNKLLTEISNEVSNECSTLSLTINELNNITLSKIKKIYQNYIAHSSPSSKNSENIEREKSNNTNENGVLDDDYINYKLKELENKRRIIPKISSEEKISEPTISTATFNTSQINQQQEYVYKPNPISITLPQIDTKFSYKNFIINSLNRDWCKNPNRNNIKCNLTLDNNNHILYPQCICFPTFVKKLTPYVLMNINDGTKNIFFTFTCSSTNSDNRWDIWVPVENVENIVLTNKLWSIKFYDFTNNELNLGEDAISILEVNKNDKYKDYFDLKINYDTMYNMFMIGDMITIKIYDGTQRICKIKEIHNDIITISDSKNELSLNDFINAKLLNMYNQYSFIIKYHYIENK